MKCVRDRQRWVTIACVLVALGLASLALAALLHWQVLQHLPRNSEETWRWVERASWVAGVGSLLFGLPVAVVSMIAAWQTRPTAIHRNADAADPVLARESEARDRLKTYLGRRHALPRMGDPSTRALALRVHPAIPLPSPDADSGGASRPAASAENASVFRSWRTWFQRTKHEADGDQLDSELPRFVDREKCRELRDGLGAAAETGGFLIVVGNSSVGKTRLLYELAREMLPDFAVLAPDLGDGDLINRIAEATFALPRLIVWLDELQRFLDGPYLTPGSRPITAAALRHLLDSPTPVVVLGTLWPEQAGQLRSREPEPETAQDRAKYPAAVDILDERRRRETSLDTFSRAEREKAAQLAAVDSRLAAALADRDFNVTEALAGVPELIRRYEQATLDQKAVLFAAIDARRLGIQGPLSEQLLSTTARGYLSVSHPDDTWFPATLADLVRHDRATTPLIEIYDAEHRAVIGYMVADYLLQRATRQRRAERIPAASWQSFIDQTHNLTDLRRLARSAENRLLYRFAIPLYRRLADASDEFAAERLADLLAEQRQIDELRARADAGDESATYRLADLLAEQRQIDELRARADAGNELAVHHLAGLLVEQGLLEELRARADAGDKVAAHRLAQLLAEHGVIQELRARADAGDKFAAPRLADLLAEQGLLEELRARAGAGDKIAAHRLAVLLAEQRQLKDLRSRADAGDESAVALLGEIEELRGRADAGDKLAGSRLADLLVEPSLLEQLRSDADAGDELAASRLADLLTALGLIEELGARADAGDELAAFHLAELLTEQNRLEELRALADAGHPFAALCLAQLLAKQGLIDELRARAATDDLFAADTLAEQLADRGQIDELRAGADAGNYSAAANLAQLLAKQGLIDELRAEVDAGTPYAGDRLADLLITQGLTEEGARLKRFGLNPNGSIASQPAPLT